MIVDLGLPDGEGSLLIEDLKRQDHSLPILLYSAAEPSLPTRRLVDDMLTKGRDSEAALVDAVSRLVDQVAEWAPRPHRA